MYSEIDDHPKIWESMKIICDYELDKKVRKLNDADGLHKSVTNEVKQLFKSKSYNELVMLETQIISKIESGGAVDIEYWEGLLKRSQIYKAKSTLRELYNQLLEDQSLPKKNFLASSVHEEPVREPEIEQPTDPIEARRKQLEREAEKLRIRATKKEEKVLVNDEEMFRREADAGMDEGEEIFNEDYLLQKSYPWTVQYKPKKPKFFNRIHSGYDWNRYNQTHYDLDNPPPKIVLGYKFNIFYPELVDKRKTPQYSLERSDNPDYMVLKFSAGAPYEDLAFKIMNKEWDYSHKSGFKCTFERGILHLWFEFKKYKYRR